MLLKTALLFFLSVCNGQFILEPKTTCQFDIRNKHFEIVSEFVPVKSNEMILAFSPCANFLHFSGIPEKFKECNRNSRACIIINKNSAINAGDRFTELRDDDDEFGNERALVSLNGAKCQNDTPYRLIIHFDCRGLTPTFIPPFDDEDTPDPCTFHVRMLAPTCKPRCTVRIANQLVNLIDLAKLPDISIPIEENRRAVFSMCRPSATCDSDNRTVACEVQIITSGNGNTATTISALGTADTEKILWDDNNQQIYIRSQIGKTKSDKRLAEIRLICNWNENSVSKGRIIKNTSNMITFEVESKLGCVKTPPNCKMKRADGFSYNLENLYKTNDSWLVHPTNKNNITLNICGPLKVPKGSVCQKSNSQICEQDGSINYGSIMRPIHVDNYRDLLTTTLTAGSVCLSNTSQYYSTNINFVCSLRNIEPTLIEEKNCVLTILWETPEACPNYVLSGNNCKVPNVYYKDGLLDLNGLHTSVDRSISLSQKLNLRYNLCGKLNVPCNNLAEASMCLISNGKESVLGLENSNVIFDNGKIRSYFYNNFDFEEDKPNINVSFICNHNQPAEGAVSIHSLHAKIAYQMTVETPLACSTNIIHLCTLDHDDRRYDLSPLMRNNSNYEVSTPEFKVQLNICRPVLTNSDTLCDLNAMACLENFTEPRMNKRYLTMGRTQTLTFDKSLVMKYRHGSLCIDSKSSYFETTIIFSCSPDEETGPVLTESKKCNHTISWGTKHACPKKSSVQKRSETECLVKLGDKILYNFTALKKQTLDIKLESNSSYELNICSGEYTFNSGGKFYIGIGPRSVMLSIDNNVTLHYVLLDNYTVNINLQCDHNETVEGFVFKSRLDKQTNVTHSSSEVCRRNIETETMKVATEREIEEIEPEITEIEHKNVKDEVIVPKKNSCVVTSSAFKTLPLNILPSVHVQSVKHSYYIDFNSSLNCKSYVCKDNKPFENNNNFECPPYSLDGDNLVIKFVLLNESACKDKELKGINVILECALQESVTVIQESDCYVVIKYQTSSICSFSNNMLSSANDDIEDSNYKYKLGWVISCSVIISIILVFTILRYYLKKRQDISTPLYGNMEFTSLCKQD